MYTNALLGVWPYIFENNPKLKKVYKCYSKFLHYNFFLFILTAYIKLFVLITAAVINFEEIFANLSITLLYTITILRVYALKTPRLESIIKYVIYTEEKIRASQDEPIIQIYESHARQSKISNLVFPIEIFLGKFSELSYCFTVWANFKEF